MTTPQNPQKNIVPLLMAIIVLLVALVAVGGFFIWKNTPEQKAQQAIAEREALYDKLEEEAQKQKDSEKETIKKLAIYDAEDIAKALLAYSESNNGKFPEYSSNRINTDEIITRYAKDSVNLEPTHGLEKYEDDKLGFVYLYRLKGPLPEGKKPTTILGYKRGPGGKAVIYADGTVKWEAD